MNKETVILKLMHTPGIGAKRLSRLLQKLDLEQYPVEEFVGMTKPEMLEKYKLTEDMVTTLKSESENFQHIMDELWKHEIRIITINDTNYPSRLKESLKEEAPPVLFVKGNLDIFDKLSVGFCGSRKATDTGSLVVKDAAAELAKKNINVVSGYAHGVDLAAHIGALQNYGTTTFVLPLGILNFQLKSSLNELVSDENYVVLSEFLPKLGWEIHNAMKRNHTICGLSKAIVLVEPGLNGGTFEAGKTALKYNRPLFVIEHEKQTISEGNEYFLNRGAKSIRVENEKLELNSIIEAVNSNENRVRQQSLF